MRASHLASQSYWDPRRRFRGKERFFPSFLSLFFYLSTRLFLSFYSSFRSFLAFSSSLVRDGILHRRDAAFIPTLSRLAGHIPVCVKEISDWILDSREPLEVTRHCCFVEISRNTFAKNIYFSEETFEQWYLFLFWIKYHIMRWRWCCFAQEKIKCLKCYRAECNQHQIKETRKHRSNRIKEKD